MGEKKQENQKIKDIKQSYEKSIQEEEEILKQDSK